MKAVLDALNFEAGNLCNSNSEVHVQFEYEKLKERRVKFYLHVYVGVEEIDDFRFYVKIIYIIDCEDMIFDDDQVMIENAIQCMIPSLTQIVITLDTLVKEER